jgi:hypothetical protein
MKLQQSMDEKEFTVQLKEEEGLKLTFQKHRLMANSIMGDGHPLFHKKKGNRKKLVELEVECMEEPHHLNLDLENLISVINEVDGTLLVSDEALARQSRRYAYRVTERLREFHTLCTGSNNSGNYECLQGYFVFCFLAFF